MEDRELLLLRGLLTETRIGTLAVAVEGAPFASLVPFALEPDAGAALIHVSGLAKHSQGLTPGAPYSLLIHESDSQPEGNPAQLARITFTGMARPLDRESADYARARDLYLAKYPKSAMTFQLGDFFLCALQVDQIRFVAGFGKAFDLGPADLVAAL